MLPSKKVNFEPCLVAKKNARCMQSTRSGERALSSEDHISFRAESVFLKIALSSLNTLSAARSASMLG